ncbi:RNA polymerase II transcription factor B subunit 2 [Hondaea fermentalgiana]|uniref:General transcription factor IIH subunit 4 n=1 Tax=Hondaea fermentalgiana TaxID=2315210 RepID=A0A2R5G3N1_9STRA|nr:RNA polymerase II transcription factor B subunit 2 [Hondaea fermentalgiana]|eukprot:GBG25647.1 RNA polymerase II transcription factor B subunit 2 [Hondaea fermentalgiana]
MATVISAGGGANSSEDEGAGDLFDYIGTLDEARVGDLFACRWSCLGVLRHLSPLAKQLVLRLTCVRKGVPLEWLSKSVVAGAQAKGALREALTQLRTLKVLVDVIGEPGRVQLHKAFASQLRASIAAPQISALPWQDGLDGSRGNDKTSGSALMNLEDAALRKWTAILHFIVGSNEYGNPGKRVVKLLVSMGLMGHGGASDRSGTAHNNGVAVLGSSLPQITRQGYEFMLKDIHEQVWIFMKHYTRKVGSPESVLQMLFRMSYCKPGTECSSGTLDETQRSLLGDFDLFGLVQIDESRRDRFFPTSLGVNVVFGQSREERMAAAARAVDLPAQSAQTGASDAAKRVKGEPGMVPMNRRATASSNVFIICETNFKVYAYTESSLHVEMLRLFVNIECILPNLIVAVITRSSIRSAFKLGITGSQIIHFLSENAHPLCKKRHRLVPDNITDQIILWEGERNRVRAQRGVLYKDFQPEEEAVHSAAVAHALENKWLLFQSGPPNMAFVILESKHDEMRAFVKRTRERLRNNVH